jgi:hypothetical protein
MALLVSLVMTAISGEPVRTACLVLAEYGDDCDLSALFAGWEWLQRRPGDLCGFDALAGELPASAARPLKPLYPGCGAPGSPSTATNGPRTYARSQHSTPVARTGSWSRACGTARATCGSSP